MSSPPAGSDLADTNPFAHAGNGGDENDDEILLVHHPRRALWVFILSALLAVALTIPLFHDLWDEVPSGALRTRALMRGIFFVAFVSGIRYAPFLTRILYAIFLTLAVIVSLAVPDSGSAIPAAVILLPAALHLMIFVLLMIAPLKRRPAGDVGQGTRQGKRAPQSRGRPASTG